MKNSIEKIAGMATKVADSAIKVTSDLAQRGKDKVDKTVIENRIAKIERQLGELVYVLLKTGEQNEPMIQYYVEQIDRLKQELELYEEKNQEDSSYVYTCAVENEGEAQEGATFCGGDSN